MNDAELESLEKRQIARIQDVFAIDDDCARELMRLIDTIELYAAPSRKLECYRACANLAVTSAM